MDKFLINGGVPLEGEVAISGSKNSALPALAACLLTGEPVPVTKRPGDKLIGATLNTSGSLTMRSERVGSQTVLSQIVQMVAQAQRSKAPMQRMADRVAGYFVITVVLIAIASLLGWGFFGGEQGWQYGIINAVAVLIIACPCALGLATPMSIMVATGRAASQGVLFEDAAAIENFRRIDTMIVDKTPIKTVPPCEGTGYEIGSMSIIKGAKNLDNAKKFYDWALTPAAQKLGAEAKSYQVPSNRNTPVPEQAPKLADIKLISFDFAKYGSSEERRRLLSKWDAEVKNLPK